MIGPSQFSAYLHALPAAEQPGVVHVDADLDGEHFSVLAALFGNTLGLSNKYSGI